MTFAQQKFENVSDLLQGCRTYRRFTQEPVPAELLDELIENARITNSAANAQPLRYVVVSSPEMVAKMQPLVKWAAALPPELGTPKEDEQPTAFIAISKTADANAFADIDLGLAAHAIITTAWEAGVGSCMMGAIAIKSIEELLEIPEDQNLRLVIALGYPSHESTLVDVPADGKLAYYLDDERNYYVPKRPVEEIARFV